MFSYTLKALTLNQDIQNTFNQLPNDQYLREHNPCYRQRRYSTGIITNKNIDWKLRAEQFQQSRMINHYLGDVKRQYDPIAVSAKRYIKTNLIPMILEELPTFHYQFGVHQMRVLAGENFMGKPAPEGIHQDGFDYVAVCCMQTINIAGGDSILVDSAARNKIVYEKILMPGEALLFNDKQYAHYASPIVPKIPGHAHRDVFVITLQRVENNHETC